MKIAVISPSATHLQEIRAVLESRGHTGTMYEGGKSRMRDIAERDQPDLMLVDGICCDPNELAHVEYVTSHYPSIAVVLMCSTHTPEFLISSMRAGVREVLPSPVPRDALEGAVSRAAAKMVKPQGPRRGKILAFMPCKGGSGATFLATNLAWQLAERGNVLLIDLDLQFGNALACVFDGKPASTIADVARDIGRLDASLLAASTVRVAPGYSILPAPEDLSHSVEVRPEHIDAILETATLNYDFVLVDVSRALDTTTIHALDRAWRIFAVVQSTLPDLRNAKRALNAFRSLGYASEKVELIVNRVDKTAEIGIDQIQRTLGNVQLRTVPNSYKEVTTAINHGDALPKKAKTNAVARNLAEFAESLNPRAPESRGLIDRLFRRA